ncbi:MAG TPA: beta-ketoacyl-[acyl-carrier-protein] synthase family protein [Bacteroidales bacterium]|nr:beta-ketoacyl-[acyl-carrier-protein] synthase family protein [Bacteroidales bacterium]HPJ58365.1 beta-ketoacyl-[acyl-carrier-protein] synthase family protein [Bacteroidales bacterium]HPR10829.1 beta-ketoacyl-[acyl-carrier-protein] synthase family protein [Bacteroidales bacterium]
MNRVVITGIGIYSTIGKNLAEVKESLLNGRSGIVLDSERKEYGFQSGLTGKLERPQLKGILDRRARVCMPEHAEFAYMSTAEAIKEARFTPEFFRENETGIIFGNDSSTPAVIDCVDIIRKTRDTTMVGSGSVFQSMNSSVSMNLSVIFQLTGINFTVSGACASGSHAIGMGFYMIRHGYQNTVICGGAQEVNLFCVGSFDALGAFSKRESEPQKASRPFDKSRDGLVPSGGAATVILESLDSAIKRGAPILAEVTGYGFSSDGIHISVPDVDGPARAIKIALKDAGIKPEQIDYINAHATSTPLGDQNEAKAIDSVFGENRPIVSSTKSMTGHEMWMAGASEVVYSIIMMKNSFIAPNINFIEPDEFSAKLNITPVVVNKNIDVFLSNSFGFGGTNSCLIIKKFN